MAPGPVTLPTLARGAPPLWGAQSLVLTSPLAPQPFAPWSCILRGTSSAPQWLGSPAVGELNQSQKQQPWESPDTCRAPCPTCPSPGQLHLPQHSPPALLAPKAPVAVPPCGCVTPTAGCHFTLENRLINPSKPAPTWLLLKSH